MSPFFLFFLLILPSFFVFGDVVLEPVAWSPKPVPKQGCLSWEEASRIAKEKFPYKINKNKFFKAIEKAPLFERLQKFKLKEVLWNESAQAEMIIIDGLGEGIENCPTRLTGYSIRLDLVFQTPKEYSQRGIVYLFKVEELWVPIESPESLHQWARREGREDFLKIDQLIKKMEGNSRVKAFLDRFPQSNATLTLGGARFEEKNFYLIYSFEFQDAVEYRLPTDIRASGFPEFEKELNNFDPQAYLKKVWVHSKRCREANIKTLEMERIEGRFWSQDREWSGYFYFKENPCVQAYRFKMIVVQPKKNR